MRGFALTVSVLSVGCAGAALYTRDDGGAWQSARSTLEREQRRAEQLDGRIEHRRRCEAYCNRQVIMVFLGARHLAEACRKVEAFAAVHYPPFLEQVNALGRGKTMREKLANNLVAGCLALPQSGCGPRTCNPAVALRLALELADVEKSI
jgi:hypothetical protein